jgi:signal transduction histidine kinase
MFATQRLYEGSSLVERNISFAIIGIVLMIVMRISKKFYNKVLILFFTMLILLFIHTLVVEVGNSARHFWFAIPILMAYYLYSRKAGMYIAAIVLAIFAIYSTQELGVEKDSFSLIDAGVIIFALSIILSVFQKDYEQVVTDLEHYQGELKAENTTLGSVAEYESKENAHKTALIIEASRFAQMGKILSMIAHHWRQPLSSISTSSANMKMSIMLDDIDPKKLLHNIDTVDSHVKQLSDTINDFRSYFKSSKTKEVLSGKNIMKDTFNIIQETMSSNGIRFDLDIEDSSLVEVYKKEMVQAILNILTNANEIFIANGQKDAKIWIRISHDSKDMIIEIEDNAGGVKVEELSRLFEPYYSTKLSRNGTGLGLYISKTIIEGQAHGSLDVSKTEMGLCFTLKVPRFDPYNE